MSNDCVLIVLSDEESPDEDRPHSHSNAYTMDELPDLLCSSSSSSVHSEPTVATEILGNNIQTKIIRKASSGNLLASIKEQMVASKSQKDQDRANARAMRPGECVKHLRIQLDRRLVESLSGSQLIGQLQKGDVKYCIVDCPVAGGVTFQRLSPTTGQDLSQEKDAVVVVDVKDFVPLVQSQVYGDGELSRRCQHWIGALDGSQLTLIVFGLEDYLRVDIESSLTALQLERCINHRLISDPEKLAVFISQFAKAVAEAPYKQDKSDSELSWYAEGNNNYPVKVDRSSVGLRKLWHQQLAQFFGVGSEVAQAIATEYSSPQALINAYGQLPVGDASLLLADIAVRRGAGPLATTRKVGPDLSKKVYTFLTSLDGQVYLGEKM